MLRIALAVEHLDPRRGGAEHYVWHLAQWLVAQGHPLHIYTAHAAEPVPGARVQVLHAGRARPARFAAALAAALAADTGRHDLVQAFNHAWPGDVLMLHGGVHRAFEQYNALSAPTPAQRRLKRWIYRWQPKYRALRANETCQFADPRRHFIGVSQRVVDDMLRYYPHAAGRCHVVYPGLDLARFPPDWAPGQRAAARAAWHLAPDEAALLFMGHNFRLKGLYDLVEALAILRRDGLARVRLLVAGRGNPRPFAARAARRGVADQITFCGAVADPRLAYAAADALVHPSFYDSFGTVCLEAAACGLPVVVARNAGVAEVLDGAAGAVLITQPCAPAALAAAIRQTLAPGLRAAAGPDLRRRAEQHPRARGFGQLRDLYAQLAGRPAEAAHG